MQFKLAVLATISAATLAAATGGSGSPSNQCNTGTLQCCNSVQTAGSDAVSKLLGLLGIVVGDVNALVGVTCSPITVIGTGATSWYVYSFNTSVSDPFSYTTFQLCSTRLLHQQLLQYALIDHQTLVARSHTDYLLTDGVVALGCTPINLNL
jgi:hypothetical protein